MPPPGGQEAKEGDRHHVPRTKSKFMYRSMSLSDLVLSKSLHPRWLRTAMSKKGVPISQHLGKQRSVRALPTELSERKVTGFEFGDLQDVSTKPVAVGYQAEVFAVNRSKHALKVMHVELAENPFERKAFEREVHLLSRLNHDHVCLLVGVSTTPEGLPCALMEYVETDASRALRLISIKQDRAEVIKQWPDAERFRLVRELSSALHYLHSGQAVPGCAILHRDLKPDNYGITSKRQLKLLDFGLAVCLRLGQNTNQRYELTGDTGSLRYMSPEVGRCEPYGTGADVYSWAVSSWEILALMGRPYEGLTVANHAASVLRGDRRPKLPGIWDPRLRDIFRRAWGNAERPDFASIDQGLALLDVPLTITRTSLLHVLTGCTPISNVRRSLSLSSRASSFRLSFFRTR